ncbi:MAG: nucleoside-diphosphate sugar epimerase/dehydratase [Acutalibacteraceae bacterium]|nr:nucleoside-diphosphate sugar epimerase/dehydratase [Acutalibacteraceae bacterium]
MSKKKIFGLNRSSVAVLLLLVYDAFVVNFSYFLALWFRFDCQISVIDPLYLEAWLKYTPINTAISLVVFVLFKLYRSIWTFASYREFFNVLYATVTAFVLNIFGMYFFLKFSNSLVSRMPITYYLFGFILQFLFVLFVRFAYRFILLERSRRNVARSAKSSRVMLVGAGAAGRMILHDMNLAADSKDKVVCLVDDNPQKLHKYLDGIQISGNRYDIPKLVEKYSVDKIYITIPSIKPADKKDILEICKDTSCELKILPDIYKLEDGKVNTKKLADVAVEDLLGREPILVDMKEIFKFIENKTILVTGGGGSIGSELCRQIAGHKPKQLIIFDIYENNAYDIEQELRENYPELNLEVLIGSVRDSRKIFDVFAQYKPDLVYHAAAHKHVPLMEHSPQEAIKNNVLGTYKTAYAAALNGCKRFVLISTDKAVNPTNIMGASKRLCEMIVQSFDKIIKDGKFEKIRPLYEHDDSEVEDRFTHSGADIKTEFVAVRFGNVLGSNGSVIPLFKKQIAKGGPVRVTHPDIIRYFMTIPEAVSLVLQAGTYAAGGEIFVLDMGVPVKIDTLARNLIRLSGLKPDVDIQIEYTGLRPGEKLYEERLMETEGLRTTPNKLINICNPVDFDADDLFDNIEKLMHICYEKPDEVKQFVESIVPTYHPAGENGTTEKPEAYREQIAAMSATN